MAHLQPGEIVGALMIVGSLPGTNHHSLTRVLCVRCLRRSTKINLQRGVGAHSCGCLTQAEIRKAEPPEHAWLRYGFTARHQRTALDDLWEAANVE